VQQVIRAGERLRSLPAAQLGARWRGPRGATVPYEEANTRIRHERRDHRSALKAFLNSSPSLRGRAHGWKASDPSFGALRRNPATIPSLFREIGPDLSAFRVSSPYPRGRGTFGPSHGQRPPMLGTSAAFPGDLGLEEVREKRLFRGWNSARWPCFAAFRRAPLRTDPPSFGPQNGTIKGPRPNLLSGAAIRPSCPLVR